MSRTLRTAALDDRDLINNSILVLLLHISKVLSILAQIIVVSPADLLSPPTDFLHNRRISTHV
jgi:hypothetical protein